MPKFSGPRMPSGKYYSKRKVGRKSKPKTGLNKVEKKQVNKMITGKIESKYFDTERIDGKSFKPQRTGSDSLVWVQGFAVGLGQHEGDDITYGWQSNTSEKSIASQHMVRTFDKQITGTPGTSYTSYVPDGKEVMPSACRTTYRIYRSFVNTASSENDMGHGAPYCVRMIRVVPKRTKFSSTTYAPKNDLFLNTYGVEYGVNSAADAFREKFGQLQMSTANVNTRKYRVLQDYSFELKCPYMIDATSLSIYETNTNSEKLITVNHQQPKKLRYDGTYDSEATREPVSGQSGELIFFHVYLKGYDSTAGQNIEPQVKIDAKCVSTFKDA